MSQSSDFMMGCEVTLALNKVPGVAYRLERNGEPY